MVHNTAKNAVHWSYTGKAGFHLMYIVYWILWSLAQNQNCTLQKANCYFNKSFLSPQLQTCFRVLSSLVVWAKQGNSCLSMNVLNIHLIHPFWHTPRLYLVFTSRQHSIYHIHYLWHELMKLTEPPGCEFQTQIWGCVSWITWVSRTFMDNNYYLAWPTQRVMTTP